jgi:hypothetical protein
VALPMSDDGARQLLAAGTCPQDSMFRHDRNTSGDAKRRRSVSKARCPALHHAGAPPLLGQIVEVARQFCRQHSLTVGNVREHGLGGCIIDHIEDRQ